MKYKLPDTIASSQDLETLIIEVKEYTRWFSHELIKKRLVAKHISKSPSLSPGAKDLIHDWSIAKPISQSRLEELTDLLKNYSTKSPNLTITLAAAPTSDIKKRLVKWIRDNIAPNVLVDFRFNATIVGGMVLHAGSRIFDWSFRRQLLESRSKIPEVLRRV